MAKRRLNGEGTISWHIGNNAYLIQITMEGKRVTKYAKTLKLAKAKLKELQSMQEEGIEVDSGAMTMKAFLTGWLTLRKRTLRASSYESYSISVNKYLIPRFGHIKLAKLSPEQINKVWEDMEKDGIGMSVIEHAHSRLATALIHAVKRKLRRDNPMTFVPKPYAESSAVRALSQEESVAVINQSQIEFNGDYYPIIHTALHTGIRRNELLALTWRDVDLDLGTISITKSIDHRNGITTVQKPKTATSNRLVTLVPASSILLRQLKIKQQQAAILTGQEVRDSSSVFMRSDGRPLLPRAVSNGFKRIAERAGYSELKYHFHESRHTHASLMLAQNVNAKVIQERLGHQHITTTLTTYSHITPTIQREASDKFVLIPEEVAQ